MSRGTPPAARSQPRQTLPPSQTDNAKRLRKVAVLLALVCVVFSFAFLWGVASYSYHAGYAKAQQEQRELEQRVQRELEQLRKEAAEQANAEKRRIWADAKLLEKAKRVEELKAEQLRRSIKEHGRSGITW